MRPAATSRHASLALQIRLAQPHEREALEALQRRASLGLSEYRDQLEAHPDAIHLSAEQIVRGQVLVAQTDEGVAGFAVVIVEQGRANLDGLFVEPEQWRKGVGTALVDAATHEARRKGLSLTVVAGPSEVPFYQHCRFTLEGEAETRFGRALRMSR